MVETTLADNINVSNVVTLPILNGTVLSTHAKPVIKLHLDMHPKHVKDTFTMMESVVTMILMDTMTATSLENLDLQMLFTYVYLFNYLNKSQLCHQFFPNLSFKYEQTIMDTMFLPPTSILEPIIHPFSDKFYPLATLVKHHVWFLPAADLFISLDGILYGIHQSYFNQSPLFQEIIHYGEANGIGTNSYHPIPFNKKEIFNDFLHLLYFGVERLEQLPQEDWVNIKQLSMDWHFPHVTVLII
jgi:hypothetical protein